MIYVIGDIHGRKDKYDQILKMISPKSTDAVFILGNVLDIGDDSIEILRDMMYKEYIYPILGEREYYARKLFPLICSASDIDTARSLLSGEDLELFEKWLTMKSEKTITDFLSLNEERKESIIDYLSEFEPYEQVEAGGRKFCLVHAGIKNFELDKPLEDYDDEDFVFEAADYTSYYFKDSFLITGHTPTVSINSKYMNKIYTNKKGHIAIDCGAAYGGKLAAICLDNIKMYYC